jgi:hypothetical protein
MKLPWQKAKIDPDFTIDQDAIYEGRCMADSLQVAVARWMDRQEQILEQAAEAGLDVAFGPDREEFPPNRGMTGYSLEVVTPYVFLAPGADCPARWTLFRTSSPEAQAILEKKRNS